MSQRPDRRLIPQKLWPRGYQSLSPLFTHSLASCKAQSFRTCCLSSGLSSPCPTPRTFCAGEPSFRAQQWPLQPHSQAKLPYPQPRWPRSGPQACQRAASLCCSQHTEYLMSDKHFHLLTQAKWQNNADRDTGSPLTGGLPRPCLSISHPEQPPTGLALPLSLTSEFLA